jgi:hypothetical protein
MSLVWYSCESFHGQYYQVPTFAGLLFCIDGMGKTGAFFTGAADDEDRDGQPVILFTSIDSSEYRLNHCQHSGDRWIMLQIEEAFTAVVMLVG